MVPLRLGLHGEIGVIVAGSQRADFPEQTERLVLSVAANLAAIGLREARLLSEQKQIADILDQRVAQRTEELARANEELKKEIVERKRAEQELKQSEVRKSAIVDSALDCIVTIDHEGCITEFNPAAARTFGYRREEVVGKHSGRSYHPAFASGKTSAGVGPLPNHGRAASSRKAHRNDGGTCRWQRVPSRARNHAHSLRRAAVVHRLLARHYGAQNRQIKTCGRANSASAS